MDGALDTIGTCEKQRKGRLFSVSGRSGRSATTSVSNSFGGPWIRLRGDVKGNVSPVYRSALTLVHSVRQCGVRTVRRSAGYCDRLDRGIIAWMVD